ncbi:MAG: glycosyltransferase [Candidatus Enteromonas sp.]|nr:glycosyltransferase [Candidatus Enteromonas sp.]
MANPVISIVMPVHRSFATIERALKSVLGQDLLVPFELVVSFDDKGDGTKEILEKYASTYPDIVRIHPKKKATGAAGSRYEGVEESRGEFVYFMDSDDELLPNCLSTLYTAQKISNADCVNCSFYTVKNGKRTSNIFASKGILTHAQWLDAYLHDTSFRAFLWTKLIRKSLLQKTPLLLLEEYPDMFEDIAYGFSVLMKADTVACISDKLYLYHKDNPSSATSTPRADRSLYHIAIFACMRQYIESYGTPADLRRFFAHKTRYYWSVWFDRLLDKKHGATKEYFIQVKREFDEVMDENLPLRKVGAFYSPIVSRGILN